MKLLSTFFIFVILLLSIVFSAVVSSFEDPCGGGCGDPDPGADGSDDPPITDPCAGGGCGDPDPCADGSCDPPAPGPSDGGGNGGGGGGNGGGGVPSACTAAAWSCNAFQTICPLSGIKTRTCTLIDFTCTDPNAVKPSETQTCTYVPPTPPQPPLPPTPPSGEEGIIQFRTGELFASNLIPDSECVAPGAQTFLFVSLKNEGKKVLKDVRVIATVQELAIKSASGPFIINKGSSVSRFLYFDVPSDAKPGLYYIKISVTSNSDSLAKYRTFEVDEGC